jgi:hypothetical protein
MSSSVVNPSSTAAVSPSERFHPAKGSGAPTPRRVKVGRVHVARTFVASRVGSSIAAFLAAE